MKLVFALLMAGIFAAGAVATAPRHVDAHDDGLTCHEHPATPIDTPIPDTYSVTLNFSKFEPEPDVVLAGRAHVGVNSEGVARASGTLQIWNSQAGTMTLVATGGASAECSSQGELEEVTLVFLAVEGPDTPPRRAVLTVTPTGDDESGKWLTADFTLDVDGFKGTIEGTGFIRSISPNHTVPTPNR